MAQQAHAVLHKIAYMKGQEEVCVVLIQISFCEYLQNTEIIRLYLGF